MWLTIGPKEDGSYEVLKDPIVQEMLDVFILRMPDYYEHKFKKSLKMPLQTLIHGDFHGGNHMYGMDGKEGRALVKTCLQSGKIQRTKSGKNSGLRPGNRTQGRKSRP